MSLKKTSGAFAVILLLGLILSYAQQQQPFSFVLLTDTQFGMYAGNKGLAQETANFEFAVAAVNRLKPGFVVILGDLVNKDGDAAQIREYRRIVRLIDKSIPVYQMPGNHDVGNEPTRESLTRYRKNFGPDHYSFRIGPVYGIVLDSVLIHTPKNAEADYEHQQVWLQQELDKARESHLPHIIVFQHHPLFLKDPREPDQYENIPGARRQELLDLFARYGVRKVFAGHTHRNVTARAGDIEIVATGPVGKPLAKDGSGIRVVTITGLDIQHRYYEFGMMPEKLVK